MPTYEITFYSDGTATVEDVSYAYNLIGKLLLMQHR